MRLGIIADIHSNIEAFRACMKTLKDMGCDEFIFLGDYVSDNPYTEETMKYLYQVLKEEKCSILRGNREAYMLDQRKVLKGLEQGSHWCYNSASGNLLYTLDRLTKEDMDFFEELPISFVFEKEGFPSITFCHGSPQNDRELLQIDGENTRAWLENISTPYLIAAHTHLQGEFTCRGKHYMNTGACGIAIGVPGFAHCMMLESISREGIIQWVPTFLKVPYDHKKVVRDMFSLGLYDSAKWFINANIHILLTGTDLCAQLVKRAGELSFSKNGEKGRWPNIEECFFREAAGELHIPDYEYLRTADF